MVLFRVGTRAAVAAAVTAALTAAVPAARSAEPQDIVLEMVRAINARDWNAVGRCVAEDVRRHSGATPGLVIESRDAFLEFQRQDAVSFPDSHQEVEEIFSSGNRVALRGTYRGTQNGPTGPFPASGKAMELPFLAILRVEDGRIAEFWVEWDNVNALTQLGHFPAPDAPAGAAGTEPSVFHGIVEASCGQCRFGLEGEGCTLAVRMDGAAYYVEGTGIDDHGDAHADDGFCEAIRRAEVTGVVRNGKFVASSFRLLPEDELLPPGE